MPERIPANWYNRVSAYTNNDVTTEIIAQYDEYPVLFGGNAGVGNFDALGSFNSLISGGKLSGSPSAVVCLLYQIATENIPSSLSGVLTLPEEVIAWSAGKLNPVFANSGCPTVPARK